MSALGEMVKRLDEASTDVNGYVTHLGELKQIASELTDSVPVSVIRECEDERGMMSFRVTLHFSLDRSEV